MWEVRKEPLPAAQPCGLTKLWPAEREDRAGWNQPSALGTSALSLAWGGEACSPQTEKAAERERTGGNVEVTEKMRKRKLESIQTL